MPKANTKAQHDAATEAPKGPPPTREIVLGSCATAALISAGKTGSSVSVAEWHAKCKGGHLSERGQVTRCICTCHADRPVCFQCGDAHTELDTDRRCLDREGCLERLREAIASNPRTEKLARIREAADAEKAANAELEKVQIAEGTRRPRNGKTPQPCQHCGEPTKGGMFVMGHDAKLKGILMRAGADGDVASIVELKMRGWYPTAGRGADRYDPVDVEAADDVVQARSTETELAHRVAERLRLIEEGIDPEAAVRQIGQLT